MRSLFRVAALGAALVLLTGAGGGLATASPTKVNFSDSVFASPERIAKRGARARFRTTVRLKDNVFAPARRTVKRGTTVRFKWVGLNPHNVTKASGPGGRFASRTTWRRGVNFAKKFKKAGTYRLVCTLHSGMELELKVVPPRRSTRRQLRGR